MEYTLKFTGYEMQHLEQIVRLHRKGLQALIKKRKPVPEHESVHVRNLELTVQLEALINSALQFQNQPVKE